MGEGGLLTKRVGGSNQATEILIHRHIVFMFLSSTRRRNSCRNSSRRAPWSGPSYRKVPENRRVHWSWCWSVFVLDSIYRIVVCGFYPHRRRPVPLCPCVCSCVLAFHPFSLSLSFVDGIEPEMLWQRKSNTFGSSGKGDTNSFFPF